MLNQKAGLRRNNDSSTVPSGFNCCAIGLGISVFTQSGSKAEVQRGSRNVRCWGQSRLQIRAAEGLLLAISRLPPLCNSDRNHPIKVPALGGQHSPLGVFRAPMVWQRRDRLDDGGAFLLPQPRHSVAMRALTRSQALRRAFILVPVLRPSPIFFASLLRVAA